ncbi:carboxypeptidase-like regulatory domain-containing protein [Psychroserpens sp.]|uniref:carboxypeptidase-like regulatory domain-containing protein n=1 Tax=Psychroserpens sp. TaxID=2020870 RepID=UPI00385E6C03
MKHQFNLDIKTPCSEDFNEFTPTSKGGFCKSCTKEVIDFTSMNSEKIATYFQNKNNLNTCGRFNSEQLKNYEFQPKRNSKFSFLGGIGLACLTLFSFGTLQAQNTESKTKNKDNKPSKSTIQNNEKNIQVKGHVTSGEDGLPLPGVNIVLEGTEIGIQSDFDGYFEFPEKLKKGDVLIFSFISLESQKVIIHDENSTSNVVLKIDMEFTRCIVMGKVASKKVYSSKKNKK